MNKYPTLPPGKTKVSNNYVKLLMSDSNNSSDKDEDSVNLVLKRLLSAIFYAISSFLIVVVNKILLTSYNFPSTNALGIGQMIVSIIVLYAGRECKIIKFPTVSREVAKKTWPLPVFYIGNMICGLGGTKHLSLPMFTVLRRFTILMTLVGEYFILNTKRSLPIILTVFAMVGGAMIAAIDDLTFDAKGYIFVLCNDFFTAANNVCVKKKLDSRDLGKYGLLFYNALFMIIPQMVVWWLTGEISKTITFTKWFDIMFLSTFLMSCFMGFILMYSTILCTAYNTALTTTIVGVLKNILLTYVGMYLGGDYVFSWTNFIGLNISMSGSLIYSYITFTQKQPKSEAG